MLNPFKSFSLYPDTGANSPGPILQWTLDPTFNKPGPYKFELQISEVPDFSTLLFSKPSDGTFYAVDNSKLHKNLGEDYIYRVKLTIGNGEIFYTKSLKIGATVPDRHKYLVAANIVRKEILRMKVYTGFPAFLLKRRTFGTVNIDEVDPVSGVSLSDNTTDYGTGIVGGYHSPLSFLISRENTATDRRFKNDGYGIEENYEVVARTVGFPNVENRDVVIFKNEGDRYSVQAVTPILFPGTDLQIIQKVSLKLIAPTDTIYNIPLPS